MLPFAPSITLAPLSVPYMIPSAKLFPSETNVSQMRTGMTWQCGHTPIEPRPSLPVSVASWARPVPW